MPPCCADLPRYEIEKSLGLSWCSLRTALPGTAGGRILEAEGKLRAGSDRQLRIDARQIRFDSLDTDEHRTGDLTVGASRRDQACNSLLGCAQLIRRSRVEAETLGLCLNLGRPSGRAQVSEE